MTYQEKSIATLVSWFFRISRALWIFLAAAAVAIFYLGSGPQFNALNNMTAAPVSDLVYPNYLALLRRRSGAWASHPRAYALFEVSLDSFVFGVYLFVTGLIFWRRPRGRQGQARSTVNLTRLDDTS